MSAAEDDPAAALIGHLEAENAVLAALRLREAAAMAEDKARLLAAMLAAAAAGTDYSPAAARLGALAETNRRLLSRALLVQERVLGLVIRAARESARPEGAAYGPRLRARGRPVSLSARL